jgi:hypothetical protein
MVETAYKNEYDFIEFTLLNNNNGEIEYISYIFSKNKNIHKIKNEVLMNSNCKNLEYFIYLFLRNNSENKCIQMNLRTGVNKIIDE